MSVSISVTDLTYPRAIRAVTTRGIVPDQIFIECLPQATALASNADIVISDDGGSITFNDCRLDAASTAYNLDGQVTSVRYWDRRWWWRYGQCDGRYNIPNPDGTINAATQVSLRLLADALLTAAGETGYSVSALPTDVYPYVDWDCDNPMQELLKLVNAHGYEVVWNPNTDVVTIVIIGSGTALPSNTDVKSVSFSVTAGERPSIIHLRGAPARIQCKLKLQAVGKETDGSIVPIDNLSYTPAAGWVWVQDQQFADVAEEYGEDERQLALESVFKWYQVVSMADESLDLPGGLGTLASITQILPLYRNLNDTYDDIPGEQRRQRAYVQGIFLPGGNPPAVENTDVDQFVDNPFELVEHLGLVIFDDPIVKLDSSAIEEAELYLTAAFAVTDNTTNQKTRYGRNSSSLSAPSLSGPYVAVREELVNTYTARYSGGGATVTSTVNNTTALNTVADGIIAQIAQEFGDETSVIVAYRQLQDISLDGIRNQVTWIARMRTDNSAGGTDTVAGAGVEFDPGSMRTRDRRRVVSGLYRQRHSSGASRYRQIYEGGA